MVSQKNTGINVCVNISQLNYFMYIDVIIIYYIYILYKVVAKNPNSIDYKSITVIFFLPFIQKPGQTFNWDEEIQNQILSSFYYGYILTQVPGGWFADRFGGKWIFGLGVLCTSVLTLLTPLAASAGVGWFMALRVLEGLGEVWQNKWKIYQASKNKLFWYIDGCIFFYVQHACFSH